MTYLAEVLADNPVCVWLLDETSGSTVTDYQGHLNLTYGAGASLGLSPIVVDGGTAAKASGTVTLAEVSSFPPGYGNNPRMRAVEAWVDIASTSEMGCFVSYGNGGGGFSIGVGGSTFLNTGNNLILLSGGQVWIVTGATLSVGLHHVFAQADWYGNTRVCLDGVQVYSNVVSYNYTAAAVSVGGLVGNSCPLSTGVKIDNAALYVNEVTAALIPFLRIRAHYLAGIGYVGPPAGSYPYEVLADTPELYYRLGESSGTAMVDSSGYGRNGAYTGSPVLGVPGLLANDSDKACTFSPTSYGSLPYAGWMYLQRITLEAVVNLPDVSGNHYIMARDTPADRIFGLQILAGYAVFYCNIGGLGIYSVTSVTPIAANTTYHIAATFNGAGLRIFVNGVPETYFSIAAGDIAFGAGTVGIFVGRYQNSPYYSADGTIDEVAIYGSALSFSRIAVHAAAALIASGYSGWGIKL